jgi:hypothetical protein
MTRLFLLPVLLAACAPSQAEWTGDLAYNAAVADLALCDRDDGTWSALAMVYTQRNCPDAGVAYEAVNDISCDRTLNFLESVRCAPRTSTLTNSAQTTMFLFMDDLSSPEEAIGRTFDEAFLFECSGQRLGEWEGKHTDLGPSADLVDRPSEGAATLEMRHPSLQGTVSLRTCVGGL